MLSREAEAPEEGTGLPYITLFNCPVAAAFAVFGRAPRRGGQECLPFPLPFSFTLALFSFSLFFFPFPFPFPSNPFFSLSNPHREKYAKHLPYSGLPYTKPLNHLPYSKLPYSNSQNYKLVNKEPTLEQRCDGPTLQRPTLEEPTLYLP